MQTETSALHVVPARIDAQAAFKLVPDLVEAMIQLEKAARVDLEASLCHLVKLRASQINGCAFCVNMHSEEARTDGESEARLQLLCVWHEASIYTDRERAALAWTEALTFLPDGGPSDEVYEEARKHLSETELLRLTGLVASINGWNRFGVGYRYTPHVRRTHTS